MNRAEHIAKGEEMLTKSERLAGHDGAGEYSVALADTYAKQALAHFAAAKLLAHEGASGPQIIERRRPDYEAL